jgi:RNase P subunit RPR2
VASELKVQCKVCGEGFRVPSRQDEATSRATSHPLAGKAYQCSKCGQKRFYDDVDHFFG